MGSQREFSTAARSADNWRTRCSRHLSSCSMSRALALWTAHEHDAAIVQAATESSGSPRLVSLSLGWWWPDIPLPQFRSAAVERIYTSYLSNEISGGAAGMGFTLVLMTALYLAQDALRPLDAYCVRLRLASFSVNVVAMATFMSRHRFPPAFVLWSHWMALTVGTIILQARILVEPGDIAYSSVKGIFSLAMKAIAICTDVGAVRVGSFILLDCVVDIVGQYFRVSTGVVASAQFQVFLFLLFGGVAYVQDLQYRRNFQLKCAVYLAQVTAEESARLQRFLTDSIGDMIMLHDVTEQGAHITYVSRACMHLLGFDPSELRDKDAVQLMHPDDMYLARWFYTTAHNHSQTPLANTPVSEATKLEPGREVSVEGSGTSSSGSGGVAASGTTTVSEAEMPREPRSSKLRTSRARHWDTYGYAMGDTVTGVASHRALDLPTLKPSILYRLRQDALLVTPFSKSIVSAGAGVGGASTKPARVAPVLSPRGDGDGASSVGARPVLADVSSEPIAPQHGHDSMREGEGAGQAASQQLSRVVAVQPKRDHKHDSGLGVGATVIEDGPGRAIDDSDVLMTLSRIRRYPLNMATSDVGDASVRVKLQRKGRAVIRANSQWPATEHSTATEMQAGASLVSPDTGEAVLVTDVNALHAVDMSDLPRRNSDATAASNGRAPLLPRASTTWAAASPIGVHRSQEWNRQVLRMATKAGGYVVLEVTANPTSEGLLCVYRTTAGW